MTQFVKFNDDDPALLAVLKELRALTRAVSKLTKRLNEQAWNTDAVSVTSLPERFGEEEDKALIERLKRSIRRRTS